MRTYWQQASHLTCVHTHALSYIYCWQWASHLTFMRKHGMPRSPSLSHTHGTHAQELPASMASIFSSNLSRASSVCSRFA